mgnify:CR=1 FL=1
MARQDDRGTILWTDKKRTFLGLPLSFTRYYLTDHQLITRVGFLSIKEDEIELYQNVGWYLEPMSTMYAPFDRTIAVPSFSVGMMTRRKNTWFPFGIRSRFPSSSATVFESGRKICGSPAEI